MKTVTVAALSFFIFFGCDPSDSGSGSGSGGGTVIESTYGGVSMFQSIKFTFWANEAQPNLGVNSVTWDAKTNVVTVTTAGVQKTCQFPSAIASELENAFWKNAQICISTYNYPPGVDYACPMLASPLRVPSQSLYENGQDFFLDEGPAGPCTGSIYYVCSQSDATELTQIAQEIADQYAGFSCQ